MPAVGFQKTEAPASTLARKLQAGLHLHSQGRFAEAERSYAAVLAEDPNSFEGLHCLSLLRMQQGDFADALALIATAIGRNPRSSEKFTALVPTLAKLGSELVKLQCRDEAAASYELLLAIDPLNPKLINDRCTALAHLGRLEEALAAADEAVAADARRAVAHLARGNVLHALNRCEEAVGCYEASLALAPKAAVTHKNLAGALDLLERHEQALQHFDLALRLDPNDVETRVNRSLFHLSLGRFAEGWADYDGRLRGTAHVRPYPQPRWDGRFVNGTLLLWGEQGLGDQILYASMLPDMVDHADAIVVEVEPRLVELFARSFPDLRVVAIGDELHADPIAAHEPLGSLGRHLRPHRDAFPRREGGFLRADAARAAALHQRLAGDGRRVIGLSWKSRNAKYENAKSAQLGDFAAVLRLPGCRFIDLQYGDTLAERETIERELGVRVERLDDVDNRNDIDGLAALVTACDAVVTVSNTTAHLAGALGRPTWILAPYGHARFWYWFKDRSDSPWYAQAQIRRQTNGQPWADLMAAVAPELL